MHKAYKFRIYPNKTQEVLINKTFGCTRFVYNHFLNKRIIEYKEKKEALTYSRCSSLLTILKTEKEWLKEVDKSSLQNSLIDLDRAFQNFFKGKAKHPSFKSKNSNRYSYRTTKSRKNIEIKGNKIKLPKLKWVRFAKSREIIGKILNVAISKTPSGKYYVSICFETETEKLSLSDSLVGVDMGLTHFAITSNGEKTSNPKYYHKHQQKLAKLQRSLSRKKKGSMNRNKTRVKVARLHEKIVNARLDFLHKLSTKLIRENQTIALEGLKVENMIRNTKLSKSIADASWSQFIIMLKYKADWYGREIRQVDSFFPSSKLCSNCGFKAETMPLHIRKWTCENCGEHHDRDVNAAINILRNAI